MAVDPPNPPRRREHTGLCSQYRFAKKMRSNAAALPYFARLSFISLRCQSQAVQHKLRQSVAAGASAATPRGRTHRNRGSEAIAPPLAADWITDQPSARGRSNR